MQNNVTTKLIPITEKTLIDLQKDFGFENPPQIVDWSILSTVERCPRKAKYSYVDKLGFTHDDMGALSTGNLLHKCYQLIHAANIFQQKLAPVNALIFNQPCTNFFENMLGNNFPQFEKIVNTFYSNVEDPLTVCLEFLLQHHDNYNDLILLMLHYRNMLPQNLSLNSTSTVLNNTYLEHGLVTMLPFNTIINKTYLFAGKCDRIVIDHYNSVIDIFDFKTTSKISDNSIEQFKQSFQFVGYHYMMKQLYPNYEINTTIEIMASKKIKSRLLEDHFVTETFQVSELQVAEWLSWLEKQSLFFNELTTSDLESKTQENKLASMNTTSCFDFFKPCEFVSLCHAGNLEERETNKQFFGENNWNPLVPN